jgi:thiol-disulfide isomerase/thioredoxin
MSKTCQTSDELRNLVKSGRGIFVLFYADWCPFSRAFLPVYEKYAAGRDAEFLRILLDGNAEVFNEHSVEVYPTVLYFEEGRVSRRLDGKHLVGLREKQLCDLIAACGKGAA